MQQNDHLGERMRALHEHLLRLLPPGSIVTTVTITPSGDGAMDIDSFTSADPTVKSVVQDHLVASMCTAAAVALNPAFPAPNPVAN
jgi:hypothetical protein